MTAPDQDVQSQEGLIGCALLGAANDILAEGITSALFTDLNCQSAFRAVEKLVSASQPVDLVTVKTESGLGTDWLTAATDMAPTEHNWSYWYPRVKKAAGRHKIWQLSLEMAKEAAQSDAEPDALSAQFEASMIAINDQSADVQEAGSGAWKELCELLSAAETGTAEHGLKTGLPRIDRLMRGLKKGTVNTIAARPGIGKSALATNIALKLAQEGKHVLFFSAEMKAPDVLARVVAIHSGEDVESYVENGWESLKVPIAKSVASCHSLNIHIVDSTSINIEQMRAYARRMAMAGRLDLVIIDYLQLYKSGAKAHSRENEVGQLSRSVKLLAMESNVPVLSLCQMNRGVESREGEPMLSDLRESGSIEQDSDTVGFLWWNPTDEQLVFCLKKNRRGQTGNVPVVFTKYNQRFSETARPMEAEVPLNGTERPPGASFGV